MVQYIASSETLADGFTKALPTAKWSAFLPQLGMEDMKVKLFEKETGLPDLEERLEHAEP